METKTTETEGEGCGNRGGGGSMGEPPMPQHGRAAHIAAGGAAGGARCGHVCRVLFGMDAMHGGGAEKVLVDLLRGLDRERFQADLFVFTRCGMYLEYLPKDVRVFALFEDPERFRGVTKFLRLAARSVFIRLARRWPGVMRAGARLAGLRGGYDVGVSFCEGMNLLLLTGARELFRRRVAWVHTNLARHKFALGAAEFARAAAVVDKVVFVAKSARRVFRELFPKVAAEKLVQIYNPVDVAGIRQRAGMTNGGDVADGAGAAVAGRETKVFAQSGTEVPHSKKSWRGEDCGVGASCGDTGGTPVPLLAGGAPAPPPRRAVILGVGRLEEVKRFDRLLEAFQRVRERGVEAELVILGSGGGLAALRERARALGVAEWVEFAPFRGNPYETMARADVLVSSSDYEGLPIVVTEAMALGLPIVATRTTGAAEILEEGRYGILTDFSAAALADGIAAMLLSAETRAHYRNALDAARAGGFFPFSSSVVEIERLLAGEDSK